MLLTITTTHQPATELGYLLGKHAARVQAFALTTEALAIITAHTPSAEEGAERESRLRLHEQRLGALLQQCGARRVLDLSCSEGRLIELLLKDKQFEGVQWWGS